MSYIRNERRSLAVRSGGTVDMRGANSLFGSIATNSFPISANADFAPVDAQSGIIQLRGTNVNATWLGLQSTMMQYWAYLYCSPLAAVIDRIAEADTNGRFQIANKKTGVVPETFSGNAGYQRVLSLFENPNPFQTWEEFNAEQTVLCKIHGFCPVFAVGPAGMDKTWTRALFNISPVFATPDINDNFSVYDENGQRVTNWNIKLLGRNYKVPSSDMIIVRDGFINSTTDAHGMPLSKIAGLDYAISNICAAMEADNVLLRKKGPLGVFSHDPRPDAVAGITPMKPDTKKDLQDDLARYGLTLGQLQYIISRQPLKWNAMSFNVQELMTKETIRQGSDAICDRFAYPAELMSGKNATYENRTSAEKWLYQNNIIPFSLRKAARYNKFFGFDGTLRIQIGFTHIAALQDDIMKRAQADKYESQALELDWKNDIITMNEYRTKKGYEETEDGNIRYSEWQKKLNPGKDNIQEPLKIQQAA